MKVDPRMEAAIMAMRAANPASASPDKPESDWELIQLKQLLQMAAKAFARAQIAEEQANSAKQAIDALFRELEVRVEMREEKLGIREENPPEPDYDEPSQEYEEHG